MKAGRVNRPKWVGNGVILFVLLVLLATIYACPYPAVYPFLSAGGIILVLALAVNRL
jgi:hypothetical protein